MFTVLCLIFSTAVRREVNFMGVIDFIPALHNNYATWFAEKMWHNVHVHFITEHVRRSMLRVIKLLRAQDLLI